MAVRAIVVLILVSFLALVVSPIEASSPSEEHQLQRSRRDAESRSRKNANELPVLWFGALEGNNAARRRMGSFVRPMTAETRFYKTSRRGLRTKNKRLKEANENLNVNNNVNRLVVVPTRAKLIDKHSSEAHNTSEHLMEKLYAATVFRENILFVFGYILNVPNDKLTDHQYSALNLLHTALKHKMVSMFNMLPVLHKLQGATKTAQMKQVMSALAKSVPSFLESAAKFWAREIHEKYVDVESLLKSVTSDNLDFLAGLSPELIQICKTKMSQEETKSHDESSHITENTFGPIFVKTFEQLKMYKLSQKLFGIILANLPQGKIDPVLVENIKYILDVTQNNLIPNWETIGRDHPDVRDPYRLVFSTIDRILSETTVPLTIRDSLAYIKDHLKPITFAFSNVYYDQLRKINENGIDVELLLSSIVPHDFGPDVIRLKDRLLYYLKNKYVNTDDVLKGMNRFVYQNPMDLLIAILTRLQKRIPASQLEIQGTVSALLVGLIMKKDACTFSPNVSSDIDVPLLFQSLKNPDVNPGLAPISDEMREQMIRDPQLTTNLNKLIPWKKEKCLQPGQCLQNVLKDIDKFTNKLPIDLEKKIKKLTPLLLQQEVPDDSNDDDNNNNNDWSPFRAPVTASPEMDKENPLIGSPNSIPKGTWTLPRKPIVVPSHSYPDNLRPATWSAVTELNEWQTESPKVNNEDLHWPTGAPESHEPPSHWSTEHTELVSVPSKWNTDSPPDAWSPDYVETPEHHVDQSSERPDRNLPKSDVSEVPSLEYNAQYETPQENYPNVSEEKEERTIPEETPQEEESPVLPPSIRPDHILYIKLNENEIPTINTVDNPDSSAPGVVLPPVNVLLQPPKVGRPLDNLGMHFARQILKPLSNIFGSDYIPKVLGPNVEFSQYPTNIALITDVLKKAAENPKVVKEPKLLNTIKNYISGIEFASPTVLFPVITSFQDVASDVIYSTFNPGNPKGIHVGPKPPRKTLPGTTTFPLLHPKYWLQPVNTQNPYDGLLPDLPTDSPDEVKLRPLKLLLSQDKIISLLSNTFDPTIYPNKGALLVGILQKLQKVPAVKLDLPLISLVNGYLKAIQTSSTQTKIPDQFLTKLSQMPMRSTNWHPDLMSLMQALPPARNAQEHSMTQLIKLLLSQPNLLDQLEMPTPSPSTTRGVLLKNIIDHVLKNDKVVLDANTEGALKYYQNKVMFAGKGSEPIIWVWVQMFILKTEVKLGEIIERVIDYDKLPYQGKLAYNELMTYFAENKHVLQGNSDFPFEKYKTQGRFLKALFKYLLRKSNVDEQAKRNIKFLFRYLQSNGQGALLMPKAKIQKLPNEAVPPTLPGLNRL